MLNVAPGSSPGPFSLKICVDCLHAKDLADFNKDKSQQDGHSFYCRPCAKVRRNAGYAKNREKVRSQQLATRRADPEKIKAQNRASYWRQPEKRRADSIGYRKSNRDKLSAKKKAKYVSDPEPVRQRNRNARNADLPKARQQQRESYGRNRAKYIARARNREIGLALATPAWADLKKIQAIYAEAARLTRETGIPHEVDHYYPLRSKVMCGLHVETNLQILKAEKNRKKSNSIPADPIASMIGI